jgi:hypothetical protein
MIAFFTELRDYLRFHLKLLYWPFIIVGIILAWTILQEGWYVMRPFIYQDH